MGRRSRVPMNEYVYEVVFLSYDRDYSVGLWMTLDAAIDALNGFAVQAEREYGAKYVVAVEIHRRRIGVLTCDTGQTVATVCWERGPDETTGWGEMKLTVCESEAERRGRKRTCEAGGE